MKKDSLNIASPPALCALIKFNLRNSKKRAAIRKLTSKQTHILEFAHTHTNVEPQSACRQRRFRLWTFPRTPVASLRSRVSARRRRELFTAFRMLSSSRSSVHSSVSFRLQVIILSEPQLRATICRRKRAFDRAIQSLGQHGLVGTSDDALMNLHDALKVWRQQLLASSFEAQYSCSRYK